MINRYVEVTDEYVKQLEHEIDNLKAINENHKKINGKLREEYNKIQNLYESVFAESKKQKEINKKAIEYINEHKHLNWYAESCYTNDLLQILEDKEVSE